jgi:bifunctional enzyme CysN/CysC
MIDRDGLREELCKDLGFTAADRWENIRRTAAIAMIASRSGVISICSLISPLRSEREAIRIKCANAGLPYFEIYVSTPLENCEIREPKGSTKKPVRA